MTDKPKIFKELERMASLVPAPFYWADTDCVIVGINIPGFHLAYGTNAIGRTAYDYYTPEGAAIVEQHSKEVMQTGKTGRFEERLVILATGETKYYTVVRSPLFEEGKVVGVVGVIIDITAGKKAARLQAETEMQNAKIEDQEKFQKIVTQAVHDINSPLATLSMIINSCVEGMPEDIRVTLRQVTERITDIVNNLRYKDKDKNENSKVSVIEKPETMLLSLTLLQILSEKREQYSKLPVKFIHDFCPECNFTFIKVGPISFRRMISNLINNAVDALDEKRRGTVNVKLNTIDEGIKITIRDTGKGMPQEVIDKIMWGEVVTAGKQKGSGIGFTQISETIALVRGKLKINSKVGKGTEITIVFPIVDAPSWIEKKIILNRGDVVVVLDDDRSIHTAWDVRFREYKKKVRVEHFVLGKKAIRYINRFPEKEKILLLADYELLDQDLTGLEVIKKVCIERAVLVTSYHNDLTIRELAIKHDAKILPKPLASEVPIEIINKKSIKVKQHVAKNVELKKASVVVIDDDSMLLNAIDVFLEKRGKIVDKYCNPVHFLENLSKYSKDIVIFMDHDFGGGMNGIDLAKQLYEKGYTKLYLHSGTKFFKSEIPKFLTTILKTDIYKLLSFVT